MKPKGANENDDGLLEYLEDIIGTSKYKQEIESAYQLTEKLNERRTEQLNRVKIVETQLNALKEDKQLAEQYIECEKELKKTKFKTFHLNIAELEQKLSVNAESKKSLEEELSKIQQLQEQDEEIKTKLKVHTFGIDSSRMLMTQPMVNIKSWPNKL
jgi:structural maintenance of chromosome 4